MLKPWYYTLYSKMNHQAYNGSKYLPLVTQRMIFPIKHKRMQLSSLATFQAPYRHSPPYIELSKKNIFKI